MTGAFVDIPNARLHYEDMGSGHPLILIHGVTLDTRMWHKQIDVLAREYRVIAYDVRGFGKSSLPGTDPYSDVEDLRNLLDHLGISKCTLIGQSMGGGIALSFALSYPSYLESLILVDSALGGATTGTDSTGPFEQIKSVAATSGIDAARRVWLRHPFFASANEKQEITGELEKIVNDYSGWHWVSDPPRLRLEPPPAQRLPEISVPSLVVVGSRDIPTFRAFADRLMTEIPDARLVVIEGAGHMSNMEDAETFNSAVLGFLEDH